jgi:arsenate reductase (thioredoxin)
VTDTLDLQQRQHIHDSARRLHGEFAGVFAEESIERVLYDSLDKLADSARYTAERFARERLSAAAKSDGLRPTDTPTVLFLCVHNAGRSQMAAGWLRALAGDRVEVLSAGSDPGGQVNPAAVEAMAEVGIDIAAQQPKLLSDTAVRASDVVITMGCGDACPFYPGKRYEDWKLDDPAGQGIEAVRPIRDEIRRRVEGLIDSLALPGR